MSKVFLGGTCNESNWRAHLMGLLTIDHFNPVIPIWDKNALEREEQEKRDCEFLLFVITPLMNGVFSIAEAVESSNKCPEKTLFCILEEDCKYVTANGETTLQHFKWEIHQLKSVR